MKFLCEVRIISFECKQEVLNNSLQLCLKLQNVELARRR